MLRFGYHVLVVATAIVVVAAGLQAVCLGCVYMDNRSS